jgi:hypothetical protein
MRQEWIEVLRAMRAEGYAVTVFTPEEMPNSASDDVEDMMCQHGWVQIDHDNAYATKQGEQA